VPDQPLRVSTHACVVDITATRSAIPIGCCSGSTSSSSWVWPRWWVIQLHGEDVLVTAYLSCGLRVTVSAIFLSQPLLRPRNITIRC